MVGAILHGEAVGHVPPDQGERPRLDPIPALTTPGAGREGTAGEPIGVFHRIRGSEAKVGAAG